MNEKINIFLRFFYFYSDESNLARYNITWCHHGDGLDATIGSLIGLSLTLIRSF
jgi:hypothetical protein